jgi:DNA-binding response OmpR family regulator
VRTIRVMSPIVDPGPRPCERVLVVNDDPDVLESMRDVLELEGAKVETAASCAEADLALARGFEPDVAVIDLRVGRGESGREYAGRLRANPATAGIPIVIMSGDVHALRRVAHLADATLEKPFEVDDLYAVLSSMCREHAARAEPAAS